MPFILISSVWIEGNCDGPLVGRGSFFKVFPVFFLCFLNISMSFVLFSLQSNYVFFGDTGKMLFRFCHGLGIDCSNSLV